MSTFAPVVEPEEVVAFLRRVPLAVDRERLINLALGFPRRYLFETPGPEIVRHFALMESLGERASASALSRSGGGWRLSLVARDRRALLARVTGALTAFGQRIVSAEGFANANALVLEVFSFLDPRGRLEKEARRRELLTLLGEAVEGRGDTRELMQRAVAEDGWPAAQTLGLSFDNRLHPRATRLEIAGAEFFGLLPLVSRFLADDGCDIETVHAEARDGRARLELYLVRDGGKLTPAAQSSLRRRLQAFAEGAFRAEGAPPPQA
jgi:UTP:GlnB (protein PII) uridylyltransferase